MLVDVSEDAGRSLDHGARRDRRPGELIEGATISAYSPLLGGWFRQGLSAEALDPV